MSCTRLSFLFSVVRPAYGLQPTVDIGSNRYLHPPCSCSNTVDGDVTLPFYSAKNKQASALTRRVKVRALYRRNGEPRVRPRRLAVGSTLLSVFPVVSYTDGHRSLEARSLSPKIVVRISLQHATGSRAGSAVAFPSSYSDAKPQSDPAPTRYTTTGVRYGAAGTRRSRQPQKDTQWQKSESVTG